MAAFHLSPPQNVSEIQLRKIIRKMERRPKPQVLLGDFNRNLRQVRRLPWMEPMTLVEAGPTFPAAKAQIDHIALCGLTVVATEVIGFPFSDHHALVADVV